MYDIWHQWDSDLLAGASGDLATASGPELGTQRVLRRLLTNPGDYIWNPAYGAGLAQFVGAPVSVSQISAVIRAQIFQEPSVAQSPAPSITVTSDHTGTVYAEIQYADADTGQSQVVLFSVSG